MHIKVKVLLQITHNSYVNEMQPGSRADGNGRKVAFYHFHLLLLEKVIILALHIHFKLLC